MKKTITLCDCCKKQIKEDEVFELHVRCEGQDVTNEMNYDLCGECVNSKQVTSLFNLFVEKEEQCQEEEQKPQKAKVKKTSKKKDFDIGKCIALKKAGWSYKDIADEMGVNEIKINNELYRAKKRGEF